MYKNTINLQDGLMDFSGDGIIYKERLVSDGPVLPYKVNEIKDAGEPVEFLRFMKANFSDDDTLKTILFYLSLIPAMKTDFKYCGVFYGGYATGKTATIEVLREVFPGYLENIPFDVFFGYRKSHLTDYFPANIKNKGAAVVPECPNNASINIPLIKYITGGDAIYIREPYKAPEQIVPTAQLIFCTCNPVDFGKDDEAMNRRLLVIPFLNKHERTDPQTKTFSEIIKKLCKEFPGIVKLLVEHYLTLKEKYKGEIPQSKECVKYKRRFIRMSEAPIE